MAKASTQLSNIKIKLKIATREAIKKAAKEMAVYIMDVLKIRIRLEGKGVNGSLPPLTSEQYIKLRSKSPLLSSDTSPNESNLTATGQMIDAMSGKAVGSKVSIEIKNTKRKKELSGAKSKLTNKQLQKIIEEEIGIEFLELNKQEREEAIDLATQIIEREIKDALRNT